MHPMNAYITSCSYKMPEPHIQTAITRGVFWKVLEFHGRQTVPKTPQCFSEKPQKTLGEHSFMFYFLHITLPRCFKRVSQTSRFERRYNWNWFSSTKQLSNRTAWIFLIWEKRKCKNNATFPFARFAYRHFGIGRTTGRCFCGFRAGCQMDLDLLCMNWFCHSFLTFLGWKMYF